MAKRISIINFKGGVGKTTLAFELATGLASQEDKPNVLIVDVDHQSSLSLVFLGAQQWKSKVHSGKSVTEVFKTFTGSRNSMPGNEIVTDNPLNKARYKNLSIIPASLELDDVEIELTASQSGSAIRSEWEKRTLLCKWLEATGYDEKFDYIIFDCPPATKMISQNAIAASHGYIIPVIPEAVMERGAPHLQSMIENGIDAKMKSLAQFVDKREKYVPDTEFVGVVVTRIKTHGPAHSGYIDDHTQHLHSLTQHWGSKLVKPYIEEGAGVSETLAKGEPVYDCADHPNIGTRNFHNTFRELTNNLRQRVDAL